MKLPEGVRPTHLIAFQAVADLVGITLVKRMTYRGDATEEYANTYHLTGAIPADSTAWKALTDALIAQEKTVYANDVSVIRAYGYNSDSPTATSVWTWDYLLHGTTVAGTLATTGGTAAPGDAAVWARWKTSRNNTRGKPIYLRKYFHKAWFSTPSDTVLPAQKTALVALAAKLDDGSFLDARTIRSRSHAETIVAHDASSFVTTRTLKRRGKRP